MVIPEKFLGLVYRAIRRLAIDWARSIDRRQIRENKVALDSPLSFSLSALLSRMSVNKLFFVQSSVFRPTKEVVTLKIWGELTFDEIARILDESLNTVASRYRYALQKLKDWVPEEMEGKKGGFFYRLMNEFEKLEEELKGNSAPSTQRGIYWLVWKKHLVMPER